MSYNLLGKGVGATADQPVTHAATFTPAKQTADSMIHKFLYKACSTLAFHRLKRCTEAWPLAHCKGHTGSEDALRGGNARGADTGKGVPSGKSHSDTT